VHGSRPTMNPPISKASTAATAAKRKHHELTRDALEGVARRLDREKDEALAMASKLTRHRQQEEGRLAPRPCQGFGKSGPGHSQGGEGPGSPAKVNGPVLIARSDQNTIRDAGVNAQKTRMPDPNEAIVLRLLAAHSEMSGSELLKASDGRLKRSFVHETLQRMVSAGFVEGRRDDLPDPRTGLRRMLYRATETGNEALRAFERTRRARRV
jgi:DNA-binding MarR family transcriptional regulator